MDDEQACPSLLLYHLEAHVRHESRRNLDGAVSLLEVLEDGDDAAAYRYRCAVEHVDVLVLAVVVLVLDAQAAGLVVGAVGGAMILEIF